MDDKFRTQNVTDVEPAEVAHEKRDIDIRIIVGFAIALVIAAIVIHLLIWLLFGVFGRLETGTQPREFPMVQTGEVRLPPSPRLQDRPREDLKAFRRQEDELLNSYTWINKQTGAVRIPIWQAMSQAVQQGFPVAER
jgi:hypothetical protein